MIINGVDLGDVNFLDVEISENVDKAMRTVQGKCGELDRSQGTAVVRSICEAVCEFFNIIFGEGTDKNLFGDKLNLIICLEAFKEACDLIHKEIDKSNKVFNKYSPNRAQRRTKK